MDDERVYDHDCCVVYYDEEDNQDKILTNRDCGDECDCERCQE